MNDKIIWETKIEFQGCYYYVRRRMLSGTQIEIGGTYYHCDMFMKGESEVDIDCLGQFIDGILKCSHESIEYYNRKVTQQRLYAHELLDKVLDKVYGGNHE